MNKNDFQLVFIYKNVYWNKTDWYWIYLINKSENKYEVKYDTWWFASFDYELVKLEWKEKDLWFIFPNSRILIEEQDIWALDFVWYVDLILIWNKNFHIHFSIWKWSPEWKDISLDWFNEKWVLMDFDINNI